MRLIAIIFTFLFASCSALFAGSSDIWSNLKNWDGPAAEICAGKYGTCLRLTCANAEPLHLRAWDNTGKLDNISKIQLSVDGRIVGGLIDGSEKGWERPPTLRSADELEQAIAALSKGNRAVMRFSDGSVHQLTLRGSSAAISKTLNACNAQASAFRSGLDTFYGAFNRYSDEGAVGFPPAPQDYEFKKYKDLDIYGGDLRSALEDGFLSNMTVNQCEALCSVTQECMFYTVNTKADACFLKRNVSKSVRFRGALSAEFQGNRYNLPSPVSSGQGTFVMKSAGWLDGDSYEDWLARRKAQASVNAPTCSGAREIGARVAKDLKLEILGSQNFGVQNGATVRWQGLNLRDRLPIWLMVTSDRPVRFDADVSLPLSPDAPNPFGVSQGQSKHRALVALFSRGAPESGELLIKPLQEGPITIEAHIVQYIRSCEEEVAFPLVERTFDAKPGAAQLVLNNELGNRAFTHEIEIEKHRRTLRLNATRLLLLHSETNTEIIQRAGSNVSVSPTHRFVSVDHGGQTEIIDVVDGATVARMDAGQLYWGLSDSFAMTSVIPWGEVNLASLFGGGTFLREQVTGPSCCYAEPHATKVGIDLENASFSVWGPFGHAVGSLQFPEFVIKDSPPGAYSSSKSGSPALFQHVYNSIGSVTPVSLSLGFDIAGGWQLSSSWQDEWQETHADRKRRSFSEVLAIKLNRVGLEANGTNRDAIIKPKLDVMNQFSRLGIELRQLVRGETIFDGSMPEIPEAMRQDSEGNYHPPGKQEALVLAEIMQPLGDAAAAAGWNYQWSDNVEEPLSGECYHVDLDQSEHSSSNLLLVRDVNWLAKLDTGKAPFYLSQAWCTAGATFGSLRPTSAIYFHDFAGPTPKNSLEIPRDTAVFFENNPASLWFDHEFTIKGDEEIVLLYAVNKGAVAIFSRIENRVISTLDDLPDGDLLQDAFVSQDLEHLVQVNSDGSLHIFDIETGTKILSGRIVDDEIALWNDDFAFDATAEAAALIDLVFSGKPEQFSLDRFTRTRHVENLAQKVLTGTHIGALEVTNIPPSIEGDIVLEDSQVSIHVKQRSKSIAQYSVFQDGVLTNELIAVDREQEFQVDRLPGARWVSVIAMDEEGLASLPISKDVGLDSFTVPIQRALIVGVNTYSDAAIPSLNYALRDGGRYAETLSGSLGEAPPFQQINFLKDRRATPEAILKNAKALLSGLTSSDHAVIFFAGHGLRGRDGRFYFGTSGTDASDIEGTALAFSEIAEIIEQSEARVTVLLDACHSGAVGTGAFATTDEVAIDLSKLQSNITILAASKGRQFSQEASNVGGGLFTYALERVLKTDRTLFDLNDNGRLEASELYRGVKDLVTEESKGNQTPWIINSRMVGDYALF